ncbi:MAG: hypothetical protein AAGH41_02595 [Pseudomonadota bacterium]
MSDNTETTDPAITSWTRGCITTAVSAIAFGILWVALSSPVIALFIAVLIGLVVNKAQQG